MTSIERLPPQSIEAEEAVIGSLLIDPDAILEVAGFLKPVAFSREKNRWIFAAILDLHEAREPIDFLTLSDLLRKRGQLEQIGGESYLISLLNAVPTSINAVNYGRLVEGAAVRRRLIDVAGKIADLAYDEAQNISEVIDRSEKALFGISEERTTRDLAPVGSFTSAYLDRIEQLHARGGETIGIPTGYGDIDRLLSGLNKSDLIIVAARPGMGKTSLLLGFALHAALNLGKRVALFSLEMSGEQLVQRMVAAQTRIDSQRLRRGQLREQEWPIFYEAIGRLSETHIYIDDTPAITPMQLRTKCRRLHAEFGLDLIMLDYLQLMDAERSVNNRVQEISEISRGLKGLARELNTPVVAASQLSRAVESRQDKRPQLSDLRDSGSIEQDSDIVMFIYRDEYYNPETTDRPNIAEISIAKHRNGPTGIIDLFWHDKLATFRNLQRQEINL